MSFHSSDILKRRAVHDIDAELEKQSSHRRLTIDPEKPQDSGKSEQYHLPVSSKINAQPSKHKRADEMVSVASIVVAHWQASLPLSFAAPIKITARTLHTNCSAEQEGRSGKAPNICPAEPCQVALSTQKVRLHPPSIAGPLQNSQVAALTIVDGYKIREAQLFIQ
jgi:hypothetical protein